MLWAAYVRRMLCCIPIRVGVHIGVYTAQKEVNICLAEVPSLTIEVVYIYILYIKNPLNPKDTKSEGSKIFLIDGFFTIDKIYTGKIIIIMFGSPI